MRMTAVSGSSLIELSGGDAGLLSHIGDGLPGQEAKCLLGRLQHGDGTASQPTVLLDDPIKGFSVDFHIV